MEGVGLIGNHEGTYRIYDGTYIASNCSKIGDWVQWSYSAGMLLNSAAVMYNITQDQVWMDRANGVWHDCSVSSSSNLLGLAFRS